MTAPDRPDADIPAWFKREPSSPTIGHVAPGPAPKTPLDRMVEGLAEQLRRAESPDPVPREPTPYERTSSLLADLKAAAAEKRVADAERAFLAAYRAQREAQDERKAALNAWQPGQLGAARVWEEWTRRCRATSVTYDEAQHALDAADAAVKGAEAKL